MPRKGQKCSDCVFWLPPIKGRAGIDGYSGKCCRFPPVFTGNGTGFPHMAEQGWCGEWQPYVDDNAKAEVLRWVRDGGT